MKEARGLSLNSLFKDETSFSEEAKGNKEKFLHKEPPHRFVMSPTNINAEDSKTTNNYPLSPNLVQDPQNKKLTKERYEYIKTTEESKETSNNGGRFTELLRGRQVFTSKEKESNKMWRKPNFPLPLWENIFFTHNKDKTFDPNEITSKKAQTKEENKGVLGENDVNRLTETYNTPKNFHSFLNKSKIDLSFYTSSKFPVTPPKTNLRVTQTPKLLNKVKFPENEIISQIYSMIQSVRELPTMEDPYLYYSNKELIPEAQRRYAKENLYNKDEMYKLIWNKKEWNFRKIHFTTIAVGTLMLFLILVVVSSKKFIFNKL